jgi:hypothetical protein
MTADAILEHSTAIALPIPDDEPVTKTVLPSNGNGLNFIF